MMDKVSKNGYIARGRIWAHHSCSTRLRGTRSTKFTLSEVEGLGMTNRRSNVRTQYTVAISLTILLGACSKRQEPTATVPDDLKKDLVAASAASRDLATAPQSYQRMRFVSDVEQSKSSIVAEQPKVAQHAHHTTTVSVPDPIASMASHTPAPVSTPVASVPEPSITIAAALPATVPMSVPAGGPSADGAITDQGHGGGGLGGWLGGVAVIRGGIGPRDKCDPRTDGRVRPEIVGRPDFAMPLPTGQPTFSRGRGRAF